MNSVLKKNLLYLRTKVNYTQEALAKALGYTRSVYKEYEYNKQADIEFLLKLSRFFNYSINDLLEKDLEQADLFISNNKIESINVGPTLKVLAVTVNDKQKENIEYVPVKAKAGYLSGYSDPQFIISLKKFSFPLPSIGSFRAFEIEGDSMPPHQNGSIIIAKYVDSLNNIKNLKTYVVVTKDEGISYKRVINKTKEKGHLVLMSDNPIYQPYTVNVNDILEVWEYYCHIGFDPKEGSQTFDERLLGKIDELSLEIAELGKLVRNKLEITD